MNWTGGSRNRVNIKNVKKNLEDYYELQPSQNDRGQWEERHNICDANVHGKKNLSQDIIFLNMLMTQPSTPLGRKVTRLHMRTPRNKRGWQTCNIDLPASPPSKMPKLQLLFPELAHSVPLEGVKENVTSLKWGSKSAETQTEIYFIDVAVQTEDLHSESSQTDKME